MRIICLDVGSKRIGVAASDPLGLTAEPLKVIERRPGFKEFDEILKLCAELLPKTIVVGLPLNEDGGIGPAAERVRSFASRLEKKLRADGIEAPVEFWDERYSTSVAEERLIEADLSRAKRKKIIDKMAAVVILEDYLEAHAPASQSTEGAQG